MILLLWSIGNKLFIITNNGIIVYTQPLIPHLYVIHFTALVLWNAQISK